MKHSIAKLHVFICLSIWHQDPFTIQTNPKLCKGFSNAQHHWIKLLVTRLQLAMDIYRGCAQKPRYSLQTLYIHLGSTIVWNALCNRDRSFGPFNVLGNWVGGAVQTQMVEKVLWKMQNSCSSVLMRQVAMLACAISGMLDIQWIWASCRDGDTTREWYLFCIYDTLSTIES